MFNYLNSILYKSNTGIENIEADTDFQPYLIQRWCSMYSPHVAVLLNETTNKYWKTAEDKKTWYCSLNTVIPKCNYKKITYIKKNKTEKTTEKIFIQKVANNLEISAREIISYIEEHNLKINPPKNND